ncbi:MAG: HlyD family secretion protein, partial [Gemmataceae bacterium]
AMKALSQASKEQPVAVPPVEPAKSPFSKSLAGAGLVEPETENIVLGTNLPGIIDELFVRVGDSVKPGQPIFRLDDRQLKAELEVRLATLANAEAMLQKLQAAPRPEELPPAKAKVTEAEANLADQQKMFDRVRKLNGSTAISEDEVVRREMAVEVAKAQLSKAKGDLALIEAGAWKYDQLVASAAVKQAKAQVEQTKIELERLTVRAPRLHGSKAIEFNVLQVNVRPGEYVGTVAGSGLVILGLVGQLHVRVDIDENDITRFRSNLAGIAKPRGNAETSFAITFVRVEPYVIPKRSLTGGNSERVDTRVLQVIYAIDRKNLPLYVGQQMDVFLNSD